MAQIFASGMSQGDLVDFLVLARTKFLALLAKLDADAGVAATTFLANGTFVMPAGIQIVDAKAYDQASLVSFLSTYITKWNAMLAALDIDAGVADTNYAALWALPTAVGHDAQDRILNIGMLQSAVVAVLNLIAVNSIGACAKLDLDGQVNDTDYSTTCKVADTISEEGSQTRP